MRQFQRLSVVNGGKEPDSRQLQKRTYPAGWAYDADAIAELAHIKARLADPLLEARTNYCRQLAEMDFAEVKGELHTVVDVVMTLKFGECVERVAV